MYKCYYCGNKSDFNILVESKNIRFHCYNKNNKIIQCLKCKLVQLSPQWREIELNKIYKKYSLEKDFKGQKKSCPRINIDILKYIKKQDAILEIGCGNGAMVNFLRSIGAYNVIGIDKDISIKNKYIINKDAVKYLHNKENELDVIYGLHFLEHLKDPKKFIVDCIKALRPNGRLLLEIPNIEEPILTLYHQKEFNSFYWRPDHLFFWSYHTIHDLLSNIKKETKNIDFKIKRKQNYGIRNHLNWLINKKPTNCRIEIPILDKIYKFLLEKIIKKSDTLFIVIRKVKHE